LDTAIEAKTGASAPALERQTDDQTILEAKFFEETKL
jgi:hypothetical protein